MKEKSDIYVNLHSADEVAVAERASCTNNVGATDATIVHVLEVVAPADLAEGYQFEVASNGQRFAVVAPAGGVKAGQCFTVEAAAIATTISDQKQRWSTGLFDCCKLGICHTHLCMGFWCPGIALAQVMTRTRLTWLGDPGSVQQVASTFKIVAVLFIVYIVVDYALLVATGMLMSASFSVDGNTYDGNDYSQQYLQEAKAANAIQNVRRVWQFVFSIYFLIATLRTRMAVRVQHNIPEESCSGCEDCCCSYWCQCCVTMQMMRQTADYDKYTGYCCTETGLAQHVDAV